MIKINQTVVDKGNGNCMQAVLASLFEVELDKTINVMDLPETQWHIPFMEWIETVGYEYGGVIGKHDDNKETLKALSSLYAVGGYFYGVVNSKNFKGVTHAVIIDRQGIIVHDPNPDKKWEGINTVETGELIYWYLFEPKDEFVYPK